MNGTRLHPRPRPKASPSPSWGSDPCGSAVDRQFFDVSRLAITPEIGREVVLARFELPMHYCGQFENFSQFIGNEQFEPLTRVGTPGLEWRLLINDRPFAPYLPLEHIVNPWGFSCCPVAIRLDENATVEFVVRNVTHDRTRTGTIQTIGGRITGSYWYNPAYGDVATARNEFG